MNFIIFALLIILLGHAFIALIPFQCMLFSCIMKLPCLIREYSHQLRIPDLTLKLIPKKSLEAALKYVDLNAEDVNINDNRHDDDESFNDLLRGMD
jgi:hypothetical protein